MADIVKEVCVHPPPYPGWANFSIIMECTPKSGHCHSVCISVRWTERGRWRAMRSKARELERISVPPKVAREEIGEISVICIVMELQ